jgi:putative hydrolase of the HAD superfamily
VNGVRPQLLSFDVDGTLYRVRRLRVAWRLRYVRGLLVAMVAAREKVRHEGPFDSLEALERREAELVAPSFDLSIEDCARQLAEIREEMPAALTARVRPFGGVSGALEAAVARGLSIAVLSDYDPTAKLANLGLDHLPWVAKVGADTIGALKPHRRAFEVLSDRAGVPPAAIVHIGDREDIDVAGALDAGCRAWLFAPKKAGASKAEHVFDRWKIDLFAPLWTE